ncbi:MAG TPA: class I SAM-dependent methyltransferase [Polyangiaceae bacterium]|jgi:hypothetical protein|nr:class I SAM-dependent methyltransferase [Polyangiaceae bacterium]
MLPADDEQRSPTSQRIAAALRAGVCPTDESFDAFLPSDLREVSSQFWTPLVVAMRVARWLDGLGVRSVVDIGSGPGKLCVAGALAGNATFTGLEHRARFVTAARSLAATFDIEERVSFVQGALGETELPRADAYYLYNPFGENLFGTEDHLDADVELGHDRYERDVAAAESLFDSAPEGTIVVTYNGFGGRIPAEYGEIRVNRHLPSVLRMWKKGVGTDPRVGGVRP